MSRQKKNFQSKGMEDSLKELNEMEASQWLDIEFKRMVIRMLKEPTDNYKELSKNYNSCLLYTSDAADDQGLV